MKVLNLTVRNFKRITNAEIAPGDRKIIKITGANMSGKSSLIDALKALTQGGKFRPARPIHDDAEEAEIIGEFGADKVEMTATLVCKPGQSDRLTIVPMRPGFTPQALMDYICGGKAFDPLEFSSMKPAEQFSMLRKIVTLKDSKGKPLDPVQIDFKNKQDYQSRAVLNARVKELDAKHKNITVPPGTPDKEVDVAAISKEWGTAVAHNSDIEVTRQRRADAITRAEKNKTLAAKKQEELKAALAQAVEDEKRFAAELKGLNAEKDKAPIDTKKLQEQIDKAGAINRAVADKRRRSELTAESKELDKQADALTATMAEREQEKIDALTRAKFPVKGLAFGDEEVLYKGLPFDQASQAEQIMVSVRIGMATNSELKIMYSKLGSLLDAKSWAALEKAVNESEWDGQLFAEIVDASGDVGIVMQDGEVLKVNE